MTEHAFALFGKWCLISIAAAFLLMVILEIVYRMRAGRRRTRVMRFRRERRVS